MRSQYKAIARLASSLPGMTKSMSLGEQLESTMPTTGMPSFLASVMASDSYLHQRRHNIYFKPEIPGLAADHPALRQVQTTNHTVCADQMPGSHQDALFTAVYIRNVFL